MSPGSDKNTVGIKRLDTPVRISDVDRIGRRVYCEGRGVGERAVYAALAAPSRDVLPGGVELLHQGVVEVQDVDVALTVNGQAAGGVKSTDGVSKGSPFEAELGRELGDGDDRWGRNRRWCRR